MRASVVSRRSRVTRTSSAPRPLIVPANTSSPGALSTGSDSPVTGAWLTALWPATTSPSSGIFSPGRMTITAPVAIASTATRRSPAASRTQRVGRRQIHQRADRVARAVERARFERLRDGEQEDDRRRLGPLAEDAPRRRRR